MSALDDIRARANAATEGPWWTPSRISPAEIFSGTGSGDDLCVAEEMTAADAEFIAHARTDVPRLLAAFDAADKELTHRAEMLHKTADAFLQEVIDCEPRQDAEVANRYAAYATQAEAALVSFRRAITEALEADQ